MSFDPAEFQFQEEPGGVTRPPITRSRSPMYKMPGNSGILRTWIEGRETFPGPFAVTRRTAASLNVSLKVPILAIRGVWLLE